VNDPTAPRIHLQLGRGLRDSHVYVDVLEHDGEWRRHEIRATGVDVHLHAEDGLTRVAVYLPPAIVEANVPVELAELIREPVYRIVDETSWYARLWLKVRSRRVT
jgi:hypothetical protein